jgi:hypothetical protein
MRFWRSTKAKAAAQLQNEGFQLAQDGGFQVGLVVALAQAQKVEEVRVFEDLGGVGVGGFDQFSLSGRVGLQGGKLGALEGLAFDLVAQLAHAPLFGDACWA